MSTRSGRARRHSSRNTPYIIGAIVAVVAVAAVVILGAAARGSDSPPDDVVVPTERPASIAQDGRALGDPAAPVTIAVYLDFQCPFCSRLAADVLPQIEAEFVENGAAKIEVRPIAILGSESLRAASAAECAAAQGKFFAYHDILYANQAGEQQGAFSDARLKEFAAALGLDTAAFDSCVDSSVHDQQVIDETMAAGAAGINSTPTVLVNGVEVTRTVEAISAAVQQAAGS
jgi:protein-disulfide isomerase